MPRHDPLPPERPDAPGPRRALVHRRTRVGRNARGYGRRRYGRPDRRVHPPPAGVRRRSVVPAIYVADPYMLGCDDDGYAPHPTDVELGGAQSAGTGAGDTTAPAGRGAEADSPAWPDPDPDPRARFGAEQPSPAMARGRFRTCAAPAPRTARPRRCPSWSAQRPLRVLQLVRGYATVRSPAALARAAHGGVQTTAAPWRRPPPAAVIDWLNGRARVHESRRRHRGARRLGQRQSRHDRQKATWAQCVALPPRALTG